MKDDDSLRDEIGAMISGGLETLWEDRAYTSEQVKNVVERLQKIAPEDYHQKIIVSGFTNYPYSEDDISQSCSTCMYYLKHRRYCELPELDVPVEPEWSCILWRI